VVSAVERTCVVVAPALHEGAGDDGCELFAGDRQRLAWIACARRRFTGSPFDEARGELAAETAERLAKSGDGRALVLVGGPRDDAAAAVLDAALRERGLDVRRFEPAPAEEEAALAELPRPKGRIVLPFLGDAAAVAALAATVDAARGAAATLVLELPRIVGPRPERAPSPLPPLAGFESAAVRAAFTRLVDRVFPEHASAWRAQALLHELGVDPELEVYSGRHLRERNAECLVNVL
jgi:hypothetical protein